MSDNIINKKSVKALERSIKKKGIQLIWSLQNDLDEARPILEAKEMEDIYVYLIKLFKKYKLDMSKSKIQDIAERIKVGKPVDFVANT